MPPTRSQRSSRIYPADNKQSLNVVAVGIVTCKVRERSSSPRITRRLTTSPADEARAADETQFLNAVRNRPTRSLSTEERDKIASIANSKPKIDLEINFEYSLVIGTKAMPRVTELGKALTSRDLKGTPSFLRASPIPNAAKHTIRVCRSGALS